MTDRPRKVVVCRPEDHAVVNAAVMALDYGDVLVRTSPYVPVGQVIVVDDPFKPIDVTP